MVIAMETLLLLAWEFVACWVSNWKFFNYARSWAVCCGGKFWCLDSFCGRLFTVLLLRRRCTGWTGVISVKKFCYVECSVLCGNVFYEQKTNKTENGTTRAIYRVASKLPWKMNENEQNRIARLVCVGTFSCILTYQNARWARADGVS